MNYADNPHRPRHQFWFGPQTWGDWLGNYSIYQYPSGEYTLRWPGNVHEAQAWTCKIGIASAIDDIKNNHPNDFSGLTFSSSPSYSTSGGGQHNMAVMLAATEMLRKLDPNILEFLTSMLMGEFSISMAFVINSSATWRRRGYIRKSRRRWPDTQRSL